MRRIRSRGEGSITKRKDGTFEVRLYVDEEGKRKRRSWYAKTRTDAVRLLVDVRQQQKSGKLRSSQTGETVDRFLTRWLEQHVAKTKRQGTLASYEQNVRKYIIPIIGKVRLTELTPEHVDAISNNAVAEGRSPSTVRLIRVIFGAALNRAIKWRIPGVENVVRMTDAPKIERKERKFLDTAQARAFLEAIKGNRLEAFYMVALYCGLRLGELQALRWRDVDYLERRQLWVAHSYRFARLGLEEPKTESSRRTVDLPECVAAALRAHRMRQSAEQAAAGEAGFPWLNDWGLVFTREYGAPTTRTGIQKDFRRMLRKAGLPRIRLHDLRHSYATLELAAGVSPKVVQESLGHARIATTLDLYAHVMPSSRREAAEALEQLLG